MADYAHSRFPLACKILEQIGLDPARIAEPGMDEHGYWEFQFDTDGRVLRPDGIEAIKVHRNWHTPHAWTFVREAREQDDENRSGFRMG